VSDLSTPTDLDFTLPPSCMYPILLRTPFGSLDKPLALDGTDLSAAPALAFLTAFTLAPYIALFFLIIFLSPLRLVISYSPPGFAVALDLMLDLTLSLVAP